MRILRVSDYRRMPWKNGGGETMEIAVFPAASGLGAFDWRVSMASVVSDGPFSLFPGIDRTLALLDGGCIRLAVQNRPPVELTPASEPLSFAADVRAEASLKDGPITDLNVMTRRGRFRHSVRSLDLCEATELRVDAATLILVGREGHCAIEVEGAVHSLGPLDSAVADRTADPWRLVPDGRSSMFIVEIDAA